MTEDDIKSVLTDHTALALTLWAEARDQSLDGRVAVASVIRNRVRRPAWWGTTYRTVCLSPQQFSCWNRGRDPNHLKLIALAERIVSGIPSGDRQYEECAFLADGVIRNILGDATAGSDHYMTSALFKTNTVAWAKGKAPTATIGSHVFFKLGAV